VPDLFGTDGVRGKAGEFLTADLAASLGRAAALGSEADRPRVLIVRDTRESGSMLASALAAGICEGGGDAIQGEVLPTPAASVLVRKLDFDLGAVVSASHNPYEDNGIKFFGPDGGKLTDQVQEKMTALVSDPGSVGGGEPPIGRVIELEGGLGDYLREIGISFPLDLSGTTVVLDCANGATFRAGPEAFRQTGAEVVELFTEPDGRNINLDCGSQHPEALSSAVEESGAAIGFAFDGDGDRVVAVDGSGRVYDGDEILAIVGRSLFGSGELGGGIAVTVMSNFGFRRAMTEAGIEITETPVGDRHVAAALSELDWQLGGEQSGHIIWRRFSPTGDGIAAALLLLSALGGKPLSEAESFERLPQGLRNVEISHPAAVDNAEALWAEVAAVEQDLAGEGRVLVRKSGTEPLLRIMVEAPGEDRCEELLERLVAVATAELSTTD
jgi:phosphoglucosamine mutase